MMQKYRTNVLVASNARVDERNSGIRTPTLTTSVKYGRSRSTSTIQWLILALPMLILYSVTQHVKIEQTFNKGSSSSPSKRDSTKPSRSLLTDEDNNIVSHDEQELFVHAAATKATKALHNAIQEKEASMTSYYSTKLETNMMISTNENDNAIYSDNADDGNDSTTEKKKFHIVFSTSCSSSQDWQSYVFFYHVWRSGQTGNVTRIVSGCKNEEEEFHIQQRFQTEISNAIPTAKDRFHIHFTPDYSKLHYTAASTFYNDTDVEESYPYFNKPLGLRHWMENKLGWTSTDGAEPESMKNTIIVIVDPDQFIMKPFVDNYTNDTTTKWHGQNKKWFLGMEYPDFRVEKGIVFGQFYSFLMSSWVNNVNKNIATILNAANWTKNDTYAKYDHGLLKWNTKDVGRYYVAGTPYIGMASDMYDIVTVWSNIVVDVYYVTNKAHLAEMYAYSTAAAYLKLRHQLAYSFMVSNTDETNDEYWNDDKSEAVTNVNTNDQYYMEWTNPSYDTTHKNIQLPHVFHYCQEYKLGPYYFFKYYLPDKLLSCPQPLLLEPPSLLVQNKETGKYQSTNGNRSDCGSIAFHYNTSYSVWKDEDVSYSDDSKIRRQAFAICHLTYKVNDALQHWKETNCQNQDDTSYERIFVLPERKKAAIVRSKIISNIQMRTEQNQR